MMRFTKMHLAVSMYLLTFFWCVKVTEYLTCYCILEDSSGFFFMEGSERIDGISAYKSPDPILFNSYSTLLGSITTDP